MQLELRFNRKNKCWNEISPSLLLQLKQRDFTVVVVAIRTMAQSEKQMLERNVTFFVVAIGIMV